MELFNNDLKFYEARIYSNPTPNDNRIKVRILPFMETESYDIDMLPSFPPLFKGTCLNGYSENNDGSKKAENVLVLSNSEWTFGWVICKSNCFNINNSSEDGMVPWQNIGYDFIKDNIQHLKFEKNLISPDYDFENLVIQTLVFENEGNVKGGMIEFYNYKSGDKYILHSSGTGIAITAGGVKIFAGPQNLSGNEASLENGKCSSITLEPDRLSIRCRDIVFDTNNISFGGGNRYILTSTSAATSYAEGKPTLSIADKGVLVMKA